MRPAGVLLLLLACAISLGAGYFLRLLTEPQEETNVRTAGSSGLKLEAATLREETPAYLIDIRYPRLGAGADARISAIIESAVAEIKKCDQACQGSAPGKYRLTGDFDSAYLGADVISIRFVVSTYTGGAHGGQSIYGLNFDSRT